MMKKWLLAPLASSSPFYYPFPLIVSGIFTVLFYLKLRIFPPGVSFTGITQGFLAFFLTAVLLVVMAEWDIKEVPLSSLLGFYFILFSVATTFFLYTLLSFPPSSILPAILLVLQIQTANIMQKLTLGKFPIIDFLVSCVGIYVSINLPFILLYFPVPYIFTQFIFDLLSKQFSRTCSYFEQKVRKFAIFILLGVMSLAFRKYL